MFETAEQLVSYFSFCIQPYPEITQTDFHFFVAPNGVT